MKSILRRRYAEHWARVREGRKNECRRLLQLGIWPIRVEPLNVPDQIHPALGSKLSERNRRDSAPEYQTAAPEGSPRRDSVPCPVRCLRGYCQQLRTHDRKLPHKFFGLTRQVSSDDWRS